METSSLTTAAKRVMDIVQDAEGNPWRALGLLRKNGTGLGIDPWRSPVQKPSPPRAPDAAAAALAALAAPSDDEALAIELLMLAGYDHAYAAALMRRAPELAPNPDLASQALNPPPGQSGD